MNNHGFLLFAPANSITIRGEPGAIIKCSRYGLILETISSITIRNVYFWGCSCNSSYNYMDGRYNVEIKILNSKFKNSVLLLSDCECPSENQIAVYLIPACPYTEQSVIIENTTISDCSSNWKIINVDSVVNFGCFINLTFENVNFTDNKFPLINFTTEYIYTSLEDKLSGRMNVLIIFTGRSTFAHNHATIVFIHDDSVSSTKFKVMFSKAEMYITDNTVTEKDSAPITIYNDITVIFEHCRIIFSRNNGSIGSGGIKLGYNGNMMLMDDVHMEFNNNIGLNGGALYLGILSQITFNATESNILLSFKNNSAQRGGAIYVQENMCHMTYQIFDAKCSTALLTVTFSNNSASFFGNQIYGSWTWFDMLSNSEMGHYKPEEFVHFESGSNLDVGSCPIRICLCKNGHPDCSISNATMEIYGYSVSLELVAVGQWFTPVAAYV